MLDIDTVLETWKNFWFYSLVGTFIASIYILNTREGNIICFRGRITKDHEPYKLMFALILNILIVWAFVFMVLEPSTIKQAIMLSVGVVFPLGGNKKSPFEDEMEGDS